MRRFVVFDRKHDPLFDLDERIVSAVRTERLKGEHKLDIETTQPLEEGMRILVRDGTLKWREWVVDEPDEHHNEEGMVGTYGCTWSMQYDLASKDGGELWPGTYSPIAAGAALAMVLATQTTWEVGYVTVGGTAGTSLYDGSVWDYLGTLQEVWGGEMEPRIVVDGNGVTHRYVDWHAHFGQTEATRRFDFGEDCTSIRRKVAPGPRFCRVVPRGGRDAQDADGIRYSDRCGVEEEPRRVDGDFVHDAGSKYVRDTVAEQLFRTKDRHGNWHYPEKVVCYDLDLDGDQEELLNKAMDDIADHTRPKTTYEADVMQFAAAGLDPHGVQLGDEVQIVDRAFGDAPLRLQARVVEMTVNELDDTDVSLVIGEPLASLDSTFDSLAKSIDAADGRARAIQAGGTLVYLQHLIENLNAEINATGGYVYVTDGDGLLTYDRAVSDPTVGAEATKVVEIKGGSIRIANSRTSGGDWNWKTVFVSGHIAAELVTAAQITAGYIGNAGAGSYWNLDTGVLYSSAGVPLSDALDDARKYATNYLSFNTSTGLDVGYQGTSAKARINASGMEVFDGSGVSEAVFNGTTARVGRSDKAHVTVTPGTGIELYDANNVSEASFSASGARMGRSDKAHVNITPSTGIELFDANNVSTLFAGISGSNSIVRVGRASGSGNVVMSSAGYVDVRNASTILAHFGYGEGTNKDGGTSVAPYYDVGIRKSGTSVGNYSVAEGYNNTASGYACHAEGDENTVIGYSSHAEGADNEVNGGCSHAEGLDNVSGAASGRTDLANWYRCTHAEGRSTQATGQYSHSEGYGTVASGMNSHAGGYSTIAQGYAQTAIGRYNVAEGTGGYTDQLFIVGRGTGESSRRNAFYVDYDGDIWCAGTLTQNSDRRLKEHHAYLGEDACEFIRALKPALYTKDGARHVGFYAQNVQAAEPREWGTETVTAQHTDESLDFDPLTLDYNALIAPLVAYTQQLEKRIDEQQETIEALVKCIEALEGGAR